MRRWLTVLALLLVAGVLVIAATDEGEVVTLVTFDRQGRSIQSELWVVDVAGQVYVRAPDEDTGWLGRLKRRPQIHLGRDEGMVTVLGVPVRDRAVRDEVDRAMTEKYGALGKLVRWVRNSSAAVPVRLDPLPPREWLSGAEGRPAVGARSGDDREHRRPAGEAQRPG